MFLPRAFYLLYFAATAVLLPFLTLYYEQIGLSGRQIGLLAGISPLLILLSAPLWGGLADATQRHKCLLMAALVSSSVVVLVLSLTTTLLGLPFFVMAGSGSLRLRLE